MAGSVNFAVAPRLRVVVVMWAICQIALLVHYFKDPGSWQFRLSFLGIGSGLVFTAWALVGALYYRSLCRLRERGVVIDGEVEGHSRRSYSVRYLYRDVEYHRDGWVDYFDMSVWRTFPREFWDKRRVPVRLLIDPAKPTKYFILPFETGQGKVSEPPDVLK